MELFNQIGIDRFILSMDNTMAIGKITYDEYIKMKKADGYTTEIFEIGKNKKELESSILKIKTTANINGYDFDFHKTLKFISALKNADIIYKDGWAVIGKEIQPILILFEQDQEYIVVAIAPKQIG